MLEYDTASRSFASDVYDTPRPDAIPRSIAFSKSRKAVLGCCGS